MSEFTLPRPPRDTDQDLRLGLKYSLIGHVILVIFVLVKSLVFPGKPLPYIPTLKVDLVGLPDVLKKDLTHPTRTSQLNQEISKVLKQAEQEAKRIKAARPPKEAAQKDEMVLKPQHLSEKSVERKNKSALERIKALAKVQDSGQDSDNVSTQIKQVKGNRVSPGTSLSGEAKEAAEANYYDVLRDRLQENWALPTWIARQNFSAQVQVFIDSRGKLRSFNFVKPSGNSQFDDAVKRALEESQPFPFPPKELESSLQSDGILVGFPL